MIVKISNGLFFLENSFDQVFYFIIPRIALFRIVLR